MIRSAVYSRVFRVLLCVAFSVQLPVANGLAPSPCCSRRSCILLAAGGVGVGLSSQPTPVQANDRIPVDPLVATTPLSLRSDTIGDWQEPQSFVLSHLGKERILANELRPLQSNSVFGEQELFYPSFLFGAWDVKATLKRKIYPYGISYLPSKSLFEGSPRNREEQVGDSCTYEVRYFSTLANTLANQMVVNLGTGVPESKIIQDRAFNAVSLSTAYKQLTPVQEVTWDYSKDPTKVKLDFGARPVGPDMRPLGPVRAEVYLTARASEMVDENTFCAAERSRSVTLLSRDGIVSETETISEFRRTSPDLVKAVSRIAVYLTPNPNSREGILWQQTSGKAVAFFDYELTMARRLESFNLKDGSTTQKPCVLTPKGVIQCQ